jgi:2-isopropylmalate synthase
VLAAVGTGPVDAVYKAIDQIVETPNRLMEISVRAVTEVIEAIGEVTVRLTGPDGEEHLLAAVGTGPVDAVYKAIDLIVEAPNRLLEFSVRAVTEGIDAIGEVTVRLEAQNGNVQQRTSPQSGQKQPRTFGGHGADTDIIVASAKAYLSALNKLLVATGRYGQPEVAAEISV